MNALRKELNSLLVQEGEGRKPAIRRSLSEEWIYATDLPAYATEEQMKTARKQLEDAGWENLAEGGWLQLRKAADKPPVGWFDGPFGPEAECCRSLLNRHPERRTEGNRKIGYALIRAGEEGAAAYETICRRLHHDWAERLRKRQKLPDISPSYFEGGK